MENLVGPVVELGKCLYVPFKRHCGYLCCYAKNVKELEDEVVSLQTRMEDMNRKLDEESRSNMTPKQVVKKWKGSVDKAVEEAEILSGQIKEEQRCLMGWCPNLRWRHGVGKKASKQIDQVQKLKENGDRFLSSVTTSHLRPPPDVEEIRSGNEFVANEVATTVMEQVMNALGDDNVRSIGIHGMGGIGKTTLVNNINNNLKGSTLFDKVILVTVSQNQNLNVIQDDIAERLGIKLDDKVNNSRANRLLEELRKLKRFLIILDDVWTELKVVELGLPRKDEHERCKIIVTTRNIEVCRQMGMEKMFEVKPLSDKDAWVLFESKVGEVLKNENLLRVGKVIVNKCGGCPLAIVTLGSTLAQEKDKNIWLDAFKRLKSSEPTQLDGIIPQVITSIKFSYDHLKDKDRKFCFLFCSLFPEDYDISLEDLRIFGIGEGFLHVQRNCLDAEVQLMAHIKRLKNCSLLLEGDKRNHVKMHDVVRLTAISIASGEGFIVKTRIGLRHWPRLDNEKECKRLSLIGNYDMEALPNSSNFPQLLTLLLKDCYGITHIPDDFFMGMRALVNLDLSGVSSLSWPKSISHLTNLRSLLLDFSRSHRWHPIPSFDLDDLAKLKNLEVLIIYGKVTIPGELAQLSNLKILNLKGVYLELIPANVISRLHNLEELYLNIWPNHRYDKKEGGCKGTNEIRSGASIVEVAALKRLTILQVRVREEVLLMPNNGWGNELQKFMILFGNGIFPDTFISSNTLEVKDCCKLVNLVPPNLLQALQLLEKLNVVNCMAMRHIFVTSATTDQESSSSSANNYDLETKNGLEHLVDLKLVDMPNLVRICDGPVPDGFLRNLKEVTVRNCGKLAPDVFSQDLVHCTENIEYIHLENFSSYLSFSPTASERLNITDQIEKKMETILLRLGRPGSNYLFQNLTSLFIHNCPTLKSICSFDSTSSTGSSTSTIAYSIFPKLESLYMSWLGKLESIIWTGSNPLNIGSSSFENLKTLQVGHCKSLRYLFSPLLAKHLPHLEYLTVVSCERLEKFILISDREEESIEDVLPQLRHLYLEYLPELTSVFSVETIFMKFPSLLTIYVSDCSKLKHLSLGPNSSPLLERIWGSQQWLQALEEDMTMEMKSRFKPLFREDKRA